MWRYSQLQLVIICYCNLRFDSYPTRFHIIDLKTQFILDSETAGYSHLREITRHNELFRMLMVSHDARARARASIFFSRSFGRFLLLARRLIRIPVL